MRRTLAGSIAALLALAVVGSEGLVAREQPLPGWFDGSLPGGVATLDSLGIGADERAFTIPVVARALHDRDARGLTTARLGALLASGQPDGATEPVTIPVPLDADTWRAVLPPPDRGDLITRIFTDRNALVLAAGLMAADDSVRALLMRDRDLLRFIYQQAAGSFVVTSRRLRIVNGVVVTPGGPDGPGIWRVLTGQSPDRPGTFLRALLTRDAGRLAWYYDTIGGLGAERLAAVWPAPSPLDAATALYAAFRDPDPQWRLQEQPFRRILVDAWTIVTRIDVTHGGAASPLSQQLWARVFAETSPEALQAARVTPGSGEPVPVAWLAKEIVSAPARERRTRFEAFRLAQRVFGRAADAALVATAVSGVRDCRALVMALERMQITSAATWSAAVGAARQLMADGPRRDALASVQAGFALVERLRHVRAIDVPAAEQLVRSLSDAVQGTGAVPAAVGRWVTGPLMRAVPPLRRPDAFTGETAYESTLLQALSGPGPADDEPAPIEWEGLAYQVDPAAAEHDRLRAMRAMLPSPGLDRAIASGSPRDIAEALTAVVYATALGDPEGAASLSPEVGTRHDFGLTASSMLREELPWSPPEERQGFGPWHVQGALVSLDLALARLAIRRIADEQMPAAPTLTLNDLATLARTVVAQVGADLTDGDRDELARAMARGRARVHDAGATIADLTGLAHEAGSSETTRQLLPWIVSRQPDAVPHLFALRDLLWLGRPQLAAAQLDRWGLAAEGLDGRRVTAMPPPVSWEDFAGRAEGGQITTQTPDLTLRLVEETARLRLPAALVPALLAFALEDYWHDVQVRFADDWPQLVRRAAQLPSNRIHDYVAALAGNGPLRAQ